MLKKMCFWRIVGILCCVWLTNSCAINKKSVVKTKEVKDVAAEINVTSTNELKSEKIWNIVEKDSIDEVLTIDFEIYDTSKIDSATMKPLLSTKGKITRDRKISKETEDTKTETIINRDSILNELSIVDKSRMDSVEETKELYSNNAMDYLTLFFFSSAVSILIYIILRNKLLE